MRRYQGPTKLRKSSRALAALLCCAGLILTPWSFPNALAAPGGDDGGHSSGGRGKHSGGGHEGSDGGHDDGEHGGGHGGRGRGHSGGGAAGAGGSATENQILRGRRPVWAGPDFPEVELGRLNVARAPSRVLDHGRILAEEETPAHPESFYGLSADEAALLLSEAFEQVERFHSPVQNLALYRELMTFGQIEFFDFEPASQLDLAAILLASAAERTKPINQDTVTALNLILGLIDLTPAETQILASKAETVRTGMDIGHGPESDHGDDHGSDSGGPGDEHDH